MNELKINKYKDFILSFFAGMNVGQGLFLRTISFKAEKDYVRNRSEMNNLYVVLNFCYPMIICILVTRLKILLCFLKRDMTI